MIKVILFDIIQVLIDHDLTRFYDLIEKKTNLPKEEIRQILKKTDPPEASTDDLSVEKRWELFKKEDKKLALIDTSELIKYWQYHMKPNKDIFEIANKLSEKYEVGILSELCTNDWDFLRKENDFSFVKYKVVSCIVKKSKKNKTEIYEEAIKICNKKPEEILFIDDKEKECTKAKELGINTILFKDKEQLIKELKEYNIR